jgi:transposase
MRFSFESRCRLVARVLDGQSPSEAAAACGASRATGYRLWRRYREGGWGALLDRPPVPHHQPRRLSAAAEREILEARAYANAGPVIVAGLLGRPPSTVWKVLRRHGVSRLPRAPREPARRYERARPGELVHIDIKRLGRFWTVGKRVLGHDVGNRSRHAGWQYVHLAIDDYSRLAYAEILPREGPADCTAFLRRAKAWYLEQDVKIERVLTDNGNGYRSHAWAATCTDLWAES